MPARRPQKGDKIQGTIISVGGLLDPPPELVVCLRPWIDAAGKLQKQMLHVNVPMADQRALDDAMAKWKNQTVTLEVVETVEPDGNFLGCILTNELQSAPADAALAKAAKEQAAPVRLRHAVLGSLLLERDFSWFAGRRRSKTLDYEVTVEVSDPDNADEVTRTLDRASELLLEVEPMLPAVRDAIADGLLTNYNDNWRAKKPALSAAAFKRKPALQAIAVTPERITLSFSDGGLFLGHDIEVRMSSDCKVTQVGLVG